MVEARHGATASIADACADEAEVLALWVIRMVAAGYATGDVACWDAAYAGAGEVLEPGPAGALVAHLTMLVRTVRDARPRGESFLPATCCRVTHHEAAFLKLLSASRRNDEPTVADAGSALTGGAMTPRLHGAANVAARATDEAASRLAEKPVRRPTATRH